MIERPDPAPTLGERLDAQARVLIARAGHSFGWAGAYGVLAAHLAGLADPADGRFGRIESAPGGPEHGDPDRSAGWAPAPDGGQRSRLPGGRRPIPQARSRGPADDAAPMRGPEVPAARSRRTCAAELREVAGPGADVMRVHGDAGPTRSPGRTRPTRSTLGADVYFRQGRLAPDDRRGAALLAHEASHVSALARPCRTPGAPPGRRGQEALALGHGAGLLAGPRRGWARSPLLPAGPPRPSRTARWPRRPPPRPCQARLRRRQARHAARPGPATPGPRSRRRSTSRRCAGPGGLT